MAQSLEQLKQKYQSAIDQAQRIGHLQNVHIENNKLLIRAEVANEQLKNQIWNTIKGVDPTYSDLTADITINSSLPQPAAVQQAGAASSGQGSSRTYTVQPGDTLSAIAQKFYGKASEYQKIFQANRDKMPDADHIRAGQEIVIP
jgi:nucleoid-associated protein YgaU